MSDNQDPLAALQKIVEQREGEPAQSSVDDKKEQEAQAQAQAQAELAAQEKRIADLQVKEEAKSVEDQEKIAQTREEFSQVIGDANQETVGQSLSEENNNDRDREEIHQIAQLKRLD